MFPITCIWRQGRRKQQNVTERGQRVRPLRASRLLSGYVRTHFDPQALQIRFAPARVTTVASGTPSAVGFITARCGHSLHCTTTCLPEVTSSARLIPVSAMLLTSQWCESQG